MDYSLSSPTFQQCLSYFLVLVFPFVVAFLSVLIGWFMSSLLTTAEKADLEARRKASSEAAWANAEIDAWLADLPPLEDVTAEKPANVNWVE